MLGPAIGSHVHSEFPGGPLLREAPGWPCAPGRGPKALMWRSLRAVDGGAASRLEEKRAVLATLWGLLDLSGRAGKSSYAAVSVVLAGDGLQPRRWTHSVQDQGQEDQHSHVRERKARESGLESDTGLKSDGSHRRRPAAPETRGPADGPAPGSCPHLPTPPTPRGSASPCAPSLRRKEPFQPAAACDKRVTLAAAIGNASLCLSFPTRRRFASQHVQKRCFAAGGEPWGSQQTSRACACEVLSPDLMLLDAPGCGDGSVCRDVPAAALGGSCCS